MKKFIKKLICISSLLSLTSCGLNIVEDSSSSSKNSPISSVNSTSNKIESTSPVEKIELVAPKLLINEETGVVTWDKVNGAECYNYVINDGEVKTTDGTTLKLEDKSTVSVQAVAKNEYSKWSNAATFYDTSDVVLEGTGKNHYVYFHDTTYTKAVVKDGGKVSRPNDPSKVNHTFDNWYSDPFYQTLFDFNKPIHESTVIYAHYTPSDLINNVVYWVKANTYITSSIQSSYTSESGWKFIPLSLVENSSIKEFSTIVTVNGATAALPGQFIIMDGLDDNAGRTYYKNGSSDFTIGEDGTYRITFSVETLYGVNSNAKIEKITVPVNYQNNYGIELETPTVDVNSENNMAFFSQVNNADSYEVIINNRTSTITKTNHITLNKGEHITVRAIKDNSIYSNWSIPKANINYSYAEKEEEKTHAYVYFYDSNTNAEKVLINTYVNAITVSKQGYTFDGWYLDLNTTKKATFPYLVTENVVFYPKWIGNSDELTKEYYELVDSTGNKKAGLVLNLDNYDFYEYEAKGVYLAFGEQYYVRSLTENKEWGPYTVDESISYNIYFSEDNIWDANTDNASNIYFAKTIRTIYFTNNKHWTDTIYVYCWSSSTNQHYASWPGTEMTYYETNSYGEKIYTYDVDVTKYDMIIFSHGSNGTIVTQTVDISLNTYTNNGFYVTEKNSAGKYEIGTYSR